MSSSNEPSVSYHTLSKVREEQMSPHISRKLIVGQNEMLGFVYLKKGSVVPAHKHVSEQITVILKGGLEFSVQNKKILVKENEILVIPPNVEHSAVAVDDTIDLDCFSPLREDWLTGNDQYLRSGETRSME
jgi:quercetin dioxygenase-like cupin family protein